MFNWLKCLMCDHTYKSAGYKWSSNLSDDVFASNHGILREYQFKKLRCTKCGHTKREYTGKMRLS
jgi:hypothetical protein